MLAMSDQQSRDNHVVRVQHRVSQTVRIQEFGISYKEILTEKPDIMKHE